MLNIEVEFLMGRAVLSQCSDRTRAEWPPHPQRLFSALVSAYGELGAQAEHEHALRWLESLPAPEIKADLSPAFRTTPSYFVPVNDEAIRSDSSRADYRHVLDRRIRHERFFPAVVPEDPVLVYQWPEAPAFERHRAAIGTLVESLTYIGHSSSPVRACLREASVKPSLCPVDHGEMAMRVPSAGRFDRLIATHELRRADESIQPPLGRVQSYERPSDLAQSIFSHDALVVALEGGPKLGMDSTLPLIQHVRNALLARFGSRVSEMLSGHDDQGGVSRQPHLAIVPLAFVNAKYADGSIKGLAFVLPSVATADARRQLRSALTKTWDLRLGPLGSIKIRYIDPSSPNKLKALDFRPYARASRTWASVTPVVLDRYPNDRRSAEAVVAAACERIGLPRPVEVGVRWVSSISGAPTVHEFHGQSKQADNRYRQHATIRFDRPVRGPVMLGAGRFIGLGLCMPLGTPAS